MRTRSVDKAIFCFLVSLALLVLFTCPTTAAAKRNKVARISPIKVTGSSSSKHSAAKSTGKGKKGSLNLQELHSIGLSQVSALNVSFFEGDSSNILFNWTDTNGDNQTWYGEALNGIGSITIFNPHISRFAG